MRCMYKFCLINLIIIECKHHVNAFLPRCVRSMNLQVHALECKSKDPESLERFLVCAFGEFANLHLMQMMEFERKIFLSIFCIIHMCPSTVSGEKLLRADINCAGLPRCSSNRLCGEGKRGGDFMPSGGI